MQSHILSNATETQADCAKCGGRVYLDPRGYCAHRLTSPRVIKHVLSDIDADREEAACALCAQRVHLYKNMGGGFRCSGVPVVKTFREHKLTNVNLDTMTADCSACSSLVHLRVFSGERRRTTKPGLHCAGKLVRPRMGRHAAEVALPPRLSPGDAQGWSEWFQAEGCFTSSPNQLTLSTVNVDPAPIVKYHGLVGGSVAKHTGARISAPGRQWRQTYRLEISAIKHVKWLTEQMLPHLHGSKKDQALLVMQWPVREKGVPLTAEDVAKRKDIHERLQALKWQNYDDFDLDAYLAAKNA